MAQSNPTLIASACLAIVCSLCPVAMANERGKCIDLKIAKFAEIAGNSESVDLQIQMQQLLIAMADLRAKIEKVQTDFASTPQSALTPERLPAPSGPNPVPEFEFTDCRKFDIPINYDPARKAEIKQLHLYISENDGQTWNKYATASPEARFFEFSTLHDGVFCFRLMIVDVNDVCDPADESSLKPELRIRIVCKKEVERWWLIVIDDGRLFVQAVGQRLMQADMALCRAKMNDLQRENELLKAQLTPWEQARPGQLMVISPKPKK